MPYRRLPKTDAARLKAIRTLLDNNDIYTVRKSFVDWKLLNKAQSAYDKLLTASEQYQLMLKAQARQSPKVDKLLRNASMYASHFLQVLFMAVERKEIKCQQLEFYGLKPDTTTLPALKSPEGIMEWAPKIIDGEKKRLKKGGRPIYNPTISMVATHYDIFREAYDKQRQVMARTHRALDTLQKLRPDIDELLLEIWNQIEHHYEGETLENRVEACKRLGVVYYYRRGEQRPQQ